MNKFIMLAMLMLSSSATAHSQQLDRLRDRAARFWEQRVHRNKLEAVKYIEPAGQSRFVQATEPQILSAKVVGIEFDPQPNTAHVVIEARIMMAEFGEMKWSPRETWVWDGKNWMLRFETADIFHGPADPKAGLSTPNPNPTHIQFKFASNKIDLGQLVQGQEAKGTLHFKVDKREGLSIRPADFPGLSFGSLQWENESEGKLDYEFESAVFSANINSPLDFLISDGQQTDTVTLQLTVAIQGQVRFAQNPKPADATKDGRVELEITNLTSDDVKLTGLLVTNPDFKIESEPQDNLPPNASTRIALSFKAHKDAVACTLNVKLKGASLTHNDFVVPLQLLHFELVQPKTYSKDELKANPTIEELLQKTKKPGPQ